MDPTAAVSPEARSLSERVLLRRRPRGVTNDQLGGQYKGISPDFWLRAERSMRNKAPLPLPLIVPLLASAGALAGAVILVFILRR